MPHPDKLPCNGHDRPRDGRRWLTVASGLLLAGFVFTGSALVRAADAPDAPREGVREPLTVDAFSVVKVNVKVVANARSRATLGAERQGTGIVIDSSGLILTIGYLVQEAETVSIAATDGRAVPASVIAYDYSTGFGLLRAVKAPSVCC